MILQEIKIGTSAIPLSHVILNFIFISYIIYTIQRYLQGQMSIPRSSKKRMIFTE